MKRAFCALAALMGLVAGASRAGACQTPGPQPLIMKQAGTGSPPEAVGEFTYSVTRGKGPKSAGCNSQSASSCDDLGRLLLHFKPSTDPDSEATAVGYRLRLVAGSVPAGLDVPREPLVAGGGMIQLLWIDGATDDQEEFDFSLTLTPVDANGNEDPSHPQSEFPTREAEEDAACAEGKHTGGGSQEQRW